MARCRRRDLWRFDSHLHRDLAIVGHVSLHRFRSDNGAGAAMFRSTAVNARSAPVIRRDNPGSSGGTKPDATR
jgi:hypothetical protein